MRTYGCVMFIYKTTEFVAAWCTIDGMFPKNWTKQEEKWTIQKNTKKQK